MVRLSQTKNPTGIYAFDVIYGAASTDLQYLEWSDLCRYVQALQASRQHLSNDAAYLRILHQQHLAPVALEPKKESTYKERILCYLLSHAVVCPLPEVKMSLLRSVQEISSKAKSQMLQPVLEALSSDKTASQLAELLGPSYEDFASMVVASIDSTVREQLNRKTDNLWSVYQATLRYFFRPESAASVRAILAQKLQTSIYSTLSIERKVELCRTLLELGHQPDIASECRLLLSNILNDVPVIVKLVTSLQPATIDPAHRASKRAKTEAAKNDQQYPSLILLAEVLGAKPLPGSVELVSCLLEALSKIFHDAESNATDKSYLEQLFMSALENSAVNVSVRSSGRASSAIRLDILVELIRVSNNPQTFNQALLLMATLARLSPEAVLHNVMPVFTFMGSNVFHRDDAYSFRVVQKTIDSIVPVMVSSLKQTPSSSLDLHIASRAFLRIFTDAANHIPRHRRTNFFGHLIDVLGPSDFLAPVCMLLVEKAANRVVRQTSEESSSSLALPLSALQRYGKDLQLSRPKQTVVETLRETQRLIELALEPTSDVKTFTEIQQDEERSAQSQIIKRQALALLIFVAHALKQMSLTPAPAGEGQSHTELLSSLLDIAVAKTERLTASGMDSISGFARETVRDALLVMPASNFVASILVALSSGEPTIQQGALNLFAEQLVNMATQVRQTAKVAVGKIIDSAKKLLSSTSSVALRNSALEALRTVAESMVSGEEHALTSTVPAVLKVAVEPQTSLPALQVLSLQSHKLGPRLIPYFKDIVKECSVILRVQGGNEAVCSQAVGVLQGLLSSIPNFWSSAEFLQIINLYLDTRGSSSKPQLTSLSTLIKTVAKKAPSKLLLTTLCDIWPSLVAEPVVSKLQGYFSLLKRVVHVSERPVVSDNMRTLFKVFLDSFELFAASSSMREAVGADASAAFIEVVVKLNEAAFKPLFRRLYDWAFSADTSELGVGRRLVFCQVYMALVDYFKILITPYMSFLVQPFSDLLQDFTKSAGNQELWLGIVNILSKSFSVDEGAFWRDEKLQHLLSPVVAQVTVAGRLHDVESKTAFSDCLVAFADVLSDDTLLKKLNVDLLMHTRSEEARIRLYALTCSEALWRAHGEKFIGFSAETATFIAECAEDDNDSVAKEAHRLKNAVESVAGRIEV
ncbi:hypothetical protein NM688_g7673 [Phlebia brevispora]|uniref:Uncharacterized protein n=1 Tax=Phlebia brevispora TaxID=194682 RepID=A0ACC1S2F4_9APHY|nr:hypothetical protein NM688_g7673 [Phlebia brevispora]